MKLRGKIFVIDVRSTDTNSSIINFAVECCTNAVRVTGRVDEVESVKIMF